MTRRLATKLLSEAKRLEVVAALSQLELPGFSEEEFHLQTLLGG